MRHLELERDKVPAQQKQITPKPIPVQPVHNIQFEKVMGQGLFSPNFSANDKLYFIPHQTQMHGMALERL